MRRLQSVVRPAKGVVLPALLIAASACGGSSESAVLQGDASVRDAGAGAPDAQPEPDDASSDGVVQEPGDPCPTPTAQINCSHSCGGPSSDCAKVTCGSVQASGLRLVKVDNASELPIVFRTPANPGRDVACPTDCGPMQPKPAYVMEFDFVIRDPGHGYRLRVDPPWKAGYFNSHAFYCPLEPAQCVFQNDGGSLFMVFTEDPNAPSRNVYLEAVGEDEQCP